MKRLSATTKFWNTSINWVRTSCAVSSFCWCPASFSGWQSWATSSLLAFPDIGQFYIRFEIIFWLEKFVSFDWRFFVVFRCRVNGCDPLDIADTELVPHWLNHTVPWGESVPKLLRQCRRFNETWSDVDQCHTRTIDHNSAQLIKCEDGWIYDLSNFHSSIVTEVFHLNIIVNKQRTYLFMAFDHKR